MPGRRSDWGEVVPHMVPGGRTIGCNIFRYFAFSRSDNVAQQETDKYDISEACYRRGLAWRLWGCAGGWEGGV